MQHDRRSLSRFLLATTALTGALGATMAGASVARAQNLPTGYSTAAGSVGFARASGTLTINQASQNAIVNYQSFSIGQKNTVNIVQPNASSALLNRVTGSTPSTIAGHLTANGQVYLINPNGIAITKTGVVKVGGGFVASSLGMSDDEWKHGRKKFSGDGASAAVTNAGTISIGRGGYAALIGGTVTNSGLISVPMGKVGLGSGEAATLDVSGDGFLQVAVPTSTSTGAALIQESGTIRTVGGTVVIDAATARAAARNAVNISGGIDAHSISGHDGSIVIGGGEGGAVEVTGALNVASRRSTGGSITLTGQQIAFQRARLDASGATGGGTSGSAATRTVRTR
jgi:filamentous hemagglutinin family protein